MNEECIHLRMIAALQARVKAQRIEIGNLTKIIQGGMKPRRHHNEPLAVMKGSVLLDGFGRVVVVKSWGDDGFVDEADRPYRWSYENWRFADSETQAEYRKTKEKK